MSSGCRSEDNISLACRLETDPFYRLCFQKHWSWLPLRTALRLGALWSVEEEVVWQQEEGQFAFRFACDLCQCLDPLWSTRQKTWQLFSLWEIYYSSLVDFYLLYFLAYFKSRFCVNTFHPKGCWLASTEAVEEAAKKFTCVSTPLCLYSML